MSRIAVDYYRDRRYALGVRLRSAAEPSVRFDHVVAALNDYVARTGKETISLSGWEASATVFRPPAPLAARLEAALGAATRLTAYAYGREFHRAKRRAAEVFAHGIRLDGRAPAAEHVAVLQNGTQGLLLALAALKERGVERVVVAAPCYFSAIQVCQLLNLSVEVIPTADYLTGALDVTAIAAAAYPSRTALLLTNPAYSLGVEWGWDTLARLLDAMPPHVPVLLDETRLGLSWRSDAPWYAADYPPNVAVLRSPSKIWFVNGAKTSFLLAAPALVREVDRLAESLIGSMPAQAEPLALAYLDALAAWLDEIASAVAGPMLAWRRRAVATLRGTADALVPPLMAAGFALSPVDSGPYAFAAAHRPLADLPCVELARQHGLLVMDARYFCHAQPQRGGFRINLCLPVEQARSGLQCLAAALH